MTKLIIVTAITLTGFDLVKDALDLKEELTAIEIVFTTLIIVGLAYTLTYTLQH